MRSRLARLEGVIVITYRRIQRSTDQLCSKSRVTMRNEVFVRSWAICSGIASHAGFRREVMQAFRRQPPMFGAVGSVWLAYFHLVRLMR